MGALGLILLVAIGGKAVGIYPVSRLHGIDWRTTTALVLLMNTRGLTELIILTVGLRIGLLDCRLYTLFVAMAVVTTVVAGPLLSWRYPQRLVVEELTARPASDKRELAHQGTAVRDVPEGG